MTGRMWLVGRMFEAARQPVDGSSAALFRVAFGLVCFLGVIRFVVNGWVSELYILPAHHFSYLGFSWVQPWPGWGMYLHFAFLALFALGIAVGYRYRWCAAGFFLLFTYVELIDKTNYLNHYYWVSLISLLIVFLPLQNCLSVDRWLALRQADDRRHWTWGTVPAAAIWLLRGQVAAVYLFAGTAKLNPDWLFQAQPLRIWLHHHTGLPMAGHLMDEVWMAYAMSWSGALFDITIVFWLLWGRTRLPAYAVGLGFHLITWLLFPSIGVFPWLMIGGALIFFPPHWPRRLISSLRPSPVERTWPVSIRSVPLQRPVHEPLQRPARRWLAKFAAVAVVLFVAAQLVVPLRHHLYPGNVRWNEEGYRFSWRVLLTEKVGYVEYRVTDPDSGRTWIVEPREYLAPLQVERMATQPDMVLETAHIIARDHRAAGYADIEVRADVFVSMNGRGSNRLVDPAVDLARVDHGIWPKRWLLPYQGSGSFPEETQQTAEILPAH